MVAGHKASSDGTYLVHWELIEPGENRGEWRVTPKGARFAKGLIRVPRFCYVYDDKREGFSKDSTDIHEANADTFDYDELMCGDHRPTP